MSFTQPGESSADLWSERSNFAGILLGGVAFGVHLAIFAISACTVISSPGGWKRSWSFLLLLCAFFSLGTLQVAFQAKFGELIWIDNRGFTGGMGGPVAWFHAHYNNLFNTLSFAGFVCANFLADGLLLYRMFIIWDKNLYIMVVPVLTYIVSTVLSALAVFQDAQPDSSKWSHASVVFEVPYWVLIVSLNVLITVAISYRLVRMRKAAIPTLGPDHAQMYTSIIAMIVESAAIYAVTGIICIITFSVKSNVLNFIQPIQGQVVCICPELIILRVSRGRAWSRTVSYSNPPRPFLASGSGSAPLISDRNKLPIFNPYVGSLGSVPELVVNV